MADWKIIFIDPIFEYLHSKEKGFFFKITIIAETAEKTDKNIGENFLEYLNKITFDEYSSMFNDSENQNENKQLLKSMSECTDYKIFSSDKQSESKYKFCFEIILSERHFDNLQKIYSKPKPSLVKYMYRGGFFCSLIGFLSFFDVPLLSTLSTLLVVYFIFGCFVGLGIYCMASNTHLLDVINLSPYKDSEMLQISTAGHYRKKYKGKYSDRY